MKPNVIIYLLFSLFVVLMSWESQSAVAVASLHQEVSQEEAIRLRILANSDSIRDQALKRDIRDRVNEAITEMVVDLRDLDDAKATIEGNLAMIEDIVESELAKMGLTQTYEVSFSEVQFPTKLYGNIVYPAGLYDAVLITLGEGKGENWWCVLFPPLCFLDMANGEATDEATSVNAAESEQTESEEDIEVSFFVVELFSSIMDRIFSSEKA
ncbi:stage II sporulation protein R [Halalkalibacter krulwichiae]|uniref:Stage II sporulation protein R (Spore_II_R) n=1 Tax=Halalkalibacter krulwichiae TaxID=199441 RepID=A0A1X9MJA7_9BACI|nr:stage II sporulation protein R [Halalkalibacter krulwichiae]ARK32760.1 Stage II sporulation protein R (spore_II_R) [Halalkalibacter krulwichiae]